MPSGPNQVTLVLQRTHPTRTPIAKKPKRRFNRRRDMTRINDRIRAPKVRVIVVDGKEEKQAGIMATREAVEAAKRLGLDLVEIAPHANPPVCKIVDFGKYKYDKAKQKKEAPKQKGGKLKEVKFRVGVAENDYRIKITRAEDFLMEGNKVKIQLMFRGRQMAHTDLGFVLMKKVQEDLALCAQTDFQPRLSGRNIGMQLSPLPEQQRARKWRAEDDHEDLGEDPEELDDEEEEDDAPEEASTDSKDEAEKE